MKAVAARIYKDIKQYLPAMIMVGIYFITANIIFDTSCPMVILTGFPCAGCGLTRSFRYLITGRIAMSWQINPMGIPIIAIVIYFFACRYILGKAAKGIKPLLIISIVILLALYVCRMYIYFPNREPYVYYENNILSHYLDFYEKILFDLGIL